MKRLSCFIVSLLLSAVCSAEGLSAPDKTDITIGYIGSVAEEVKERTVFPTFEYLKKTLGDRYNLSLITISSANLEVELQQFKPDFLMAPAEIYLMLSTSPQYGSHDIATLKSIYSNNSGGDNGALFITRGDRSDIRTIEDMRDKTVTAQNPTSLIGWWSALGEIERHGFSSDNFFKAASFVRDHPLKIIEEVISGASDVGILPTCYLEMLEGDGLLSPGAVKPVALYKADDAASLYCRRSTKDLYPGFVISSLKGTPDAVVKDFIRALFAMPPTEESEWSATGDYIGAIDLMRRLRFGMYKNLRDTSPGALLLRYKTELLILTLILLFLIANELRVHRLVDQRTLELSSAIKAKEKAEKEAIAGRKRLSHIERSGVISQMSNIIAHELKQPLGALLNYAAVLNIRLKGSLESDDLSKQIIDNISAETKRISMIVDSVRKFARKEQAPQMPCQLNLIVEKAIRTFHQQEDAQTLVPFITNGLSAHVLADPLSLELLILNLIRNAASASKAVKKPKVGIELTEKGSKWNLTIWNNGEELNEDAFERLEHAAESTKAEGLGLGLSIVREIADMHGASLHFKRKPKGGVIAELLIDRLKQKEMNNE